MNTKDEVIVELKNDHTLQAQAKRVDEILLRCMKQVIKHTKIGVEGAIMNRWIKSAEPVFDRSGLKLIFTEGCLEADKKQHRNTAECFPTIQQASSMSQDELETACPQGFRVLWTEAGGLWGYQPENEVVPQVA